MATIPAKSNRMKLLDRPDVRKVWMFSFEAAGLAQAGGLGEAVGGLARTLVSDYGKKVTVFLPSHGRHRDVNLRDSYGLKEETRFIAKGDRIGVNGVPYPFLAGIERGHSGGVEFVLVKGMDVPTSRWLDDPILYGRDITFEKMALFSRTVRLYSEFLMAMKLENQLPDLIHANDWHMVPAGVSVRQNLEEKAGRIPLVFTVHLLSFIALPWHFASEDWSGIEDFQQNAISPEGRGPLRTIRQIWETECHGSLEKFGCYEADFVTSVSKSYLKHDILNYVGRVINGKSGHIYNGCDWDPDEIRSTYVPELPSQSSAYNDVGQDVSRKNLRALFLTKSIARLREMGEGRNALGTLTGSSGSRTIRPFKSDGPMVLMTGRLSPQKGVDLLLDSVLVVRKSVPDARFVLFLLPSSDEENSAIQERASTLSDNVRVIFVRDRPLYLMAHTVADVYAMPSRSEPFGISALEAMVTGNPVVGSDLGGISETVLDINRFGEKGTGLLFPPGDTRALADSISALLCTMRIDEESSSESKKESLVGNIPIRSLRDLVSRDGNLGTRIRQNCASRVEKNFRWNNAGAIALNRYAAAAKHSLRYS